MAKSTPSNEEYDEQMLAILMKNHPSRENLVSTFNTGLELDLKALASTLRFRHTCIYEPEFVDALIMRLPPPRRTTALVFPNGKVICTGAKTEFDAQYMAGYVTTCISGELGDCIVNHVFDYKVEGAPTDYPIWESGDLKEGEDDPLKCNHRPTT